MYNVLKRLTIYAVNKRFLLHVETTYNTYHHAFRIIVLCGSSCRGWHYCCDCVLLSERQLLLGNYYGEVLSKIILALYIKLLGSAIFSKGYLSNIYVREVPIVCIT